tara:strand:+ start:1167 stop:1631 length:465 start_codon:yes stop_codon:yes gene_type:complete
VGTDTDWNTVSASLYHTLAIKNDGTLWSWGNNEDGQLGLGDMADRNTPQQVGGDSDWMALGGGGWHHSGALKDDGTLWNWGSNDHGLDCDAVDCKYPQQKESATNWIAITVGRYRNLAIAEDDGSLWTWGSNYDGLIGLGEGGSDNVSSPTVIR